MNGSASGRAVDQQRVERRGPLAAAVARREPVGCGRTPRWAASTWKTTASGTTTVRWPARAARQPKSTSLPKQRQPRVEAELLEHGAADQHAGGVDREHVADPVVLALVVLAALEAGLAAAGAADRDADLEQPAQRGPLAELGAEDVGRRGGRRRRRAAARARRGRGRCRRGAARPTRPGRRAGERRRARRGPRRRTRWSRGASSTAPSPSALAQQRRARRRCCRCRPRRTRSGGRVWSAQPVEDGRQPAGAVVADEQRGHGAVRAG